MRDTQSDHTDWIQRVLHEHEGPLLRYAWRFCGDLERARDAVQDTFVRLCREDRGKVENHLVQWLFTVCRRRLLEVARKEQRMKPLSDSKMASTESREPNPARHTERTDAAC